VTVSGPSDHSVLHCVLYQQHSCSGATIALVQMGQQLNCPKVLMAAGSAKGSMLLTVMFWCADVGTMCT
jgi:hypothetical protein